MAQTAERQGQKPGCVRQLLPREVRYRLPRGTRAWQDNRSGLVLVSLPEGEHDLANIRNDRTEVLAVIRTQHFAGVIWARS